MTFGGEISNAQIWKVEAKKRDNRGINSINGDPIRLTFELTFFGKMERLLKLFSC